MLSQLRIRDLIVVERADLEFCPGFNVLSGSTGAGKSVLLAALTLVTGGRGQLEWIRPGCKKAVVEAHFTLDDREIATLAEAGFETDNGELILKRELSHGGRGLATCDGFPIPVKRLRELGSLLVERQDQHEQLALIEPEVQLRFLDHFAACAPELDRYQTSLSRVKSLEREKQTLTRKLSRLRKDEDYIRFQLDEIDTLSPVEGELDELQAREVRLRNASRIETLMREGIGLIDGGDRSLVSLLGELQKVIRRLEKLGENDPVPDLDQIEEQLQEFSRELHTRVDGISLAAREGNSLAQRLGKLKALERKHSLSLGEIITWAHEQREALLSLESLAGELAELEATRREAEAELSERARALSDKRIAAAVPLGERWEQQLRQLGLARCEMRMELSPRPEDGGWIDLDSRRYHAGETGMDQLNLLVKTNPDLPEGTLREVPSGGELSRIALARHLLGVDRAVPSLLLLDEVDAGLGADLARVLARQLADLAGWRQLILVTHQAGLAASAQNHFRVRKSFDGGRTRAEVELLDEKERLLEIARMLGEHDPGEETLKLAGSLLQDPLD
jgi:DNA repair protein RecN (Recombination protein N)